MSRGAQALRQGDVTKAIKGAVKAGLSVKRFEVDKDGKIIEESVDREAVDPTKIVEACERRRLGK